MAKMHRKLRDRERIAKRRAARLRAMPHEERAAYDAWLRDHAPGPSAARAMKRRDRAEAEAMRLRIAAPYLPPPNPELEVLRRLIEAKRKEIEDLNRRIGAPKGEPRRSPLDDDTQER